MDGKSILKYCNFLYVVKNSSSNTRRIKLVHSEEARCHTFFVDLKKKFSFVCRSNRKDETRSLFDPQRNAASEFLYDVCRRARGAQSRISRNGEGNGRFGACARKRKWWRRRWDRPLQGRGPARARAKTMQDRAKERERCKFVT